MNKTVILLFCIAISSCGSTPTSVDSGTGYQASIPDFDYDKEQKDYMAAHKYELDKKNINKTLNNAKTSLVTYLNTVGQMNECSKYTIDSPNLPSPRQLAKPVNESEARAVAKEFAKQVSAYAKSVGTNFNWNWQNGIDIKTGKNYIDKVMGNIYFDAVLKYASCGSGMKSLDKPHFQVINSNYEIVFTKRSRSQLATKSSAVLRGECGKDTGDFHFFPNGYRRLAIATFNHTSTSVNLQPYVNKGSNMYRNDKKRYTDAHRGSPFEKLFKTSPCNEFKKEYYEILRNSEVKFQQQYK